MKITVIAGVISTERKDYIVSENIVFKSLK